MVWSNPYNGLLFHSAHISACSERSVWRSGSPRRPTRGARRLVALRAAAIGTLVLILLNPTRVQETRQTGPQPAAVFLLDQSRSMSLEAPQSRAQAGHELIQTGAFPAAVGTTAPDPTIRIRPRGHGARR